MTGPILVIDLGKYKSVACVYHGEAEVSFRSLAPGPEALLALARQCRPRVVVVEAWPAVWSHLTRRQADASRGGRVVLGTGPTLLEAIIAHHRPDPSPAALAARADRGPRRAHPATTGTPRGPCGSGRR